MSAIATREIDAASFLSLIDGGYEGFHKLCRERSRLMLRKWYADHDYQPDSALVRQHVADCAEHLEGEIWGRLADARNGYNPERGAASTWVYHVAFFVVQNFVRDVIAPQMFALRNEHADSESRPQQAADRLAFKLGRFAMPAECGLEISENRNEAAQVMLTLDKRERRVLMDYAKGIPAQETATRMRVSQPTVSVIRNRLRELGLMPPVGKMSA